MSTTVVTMKLPHSRSFDLGGLRLNFKHRKGGLDAFQQKYDSLCVQCAKPCKTPLYSPTSASVQEPAIDTATASQILPFLYLGNERDAANETRLRDLGITHVLNVTAHIPFFAEQDRLGLTCKRLPASDSGQQNLRQYFQTASDFIDEVRMSCGRVLVHCQAGVSRSATVTLAYLMYHTKMTLHEAFALLKSRRPIVSPNFNFMGQLYSLEQALEKGEENRKLHPTLDLGHPVVPPTPGLLEVPQTPLPKSVSTSSISGFGSNGFKF